VLLVLALLAAVSAIAWPAVEGSFASSRLRTAADMVRAVWSEARLEAMRTGVIHEFRYQDGGSAYLVRSWAATADPAAAPPPAADATATVEPVSDFEAAFTKNVLPEDVTFAVGTQLIDQRASLTAAVAGANVAAEGVYSPPILFYPDGTTVDAVVHLKNEQGLYVRIALRGLTGAARLSELLSADELLEQ
jgi:hypothetical protein